MSNNKNLLDKLDAILDQLKSNNRIAKPVILRSFIVGIMTGLGATVGLTIFITILSFLVNLFGGLPVIGNMFINLGSYLHK